MAISGKRQNIYNQKFQCFERIDKWDLNIYNFVKCYNFVETG